MVNEEEGQKTLMEKIADARLEKNAVEWEEAKALFDEYRIEEMCIEAARNGYDWLTIPVQSLPLFVEDAYSGNRRYLKLAALIEKEGLGVELTFCETEESGGDPDTIKCVRCRTVNSRLTNESYCSIEIDIPKDD